MLPLDVDETAPDVNILYWNLTAAVWCDTELSDWVSIKQGLRQECLASRHQFALYTEIIMRAINELDGFKIGGQVVSNLRYAYDSIILAESEEQLQHLINVVVTESERKILYLNSAKSFTMVFSNTTKVNPTGNITVHEKDLEQHQSFVYMENILTSDARCDKEIRRRIIIAKSTFTSMNKLLISRSIGIAVRMRVLKCCKSLLLYIVHRQLSFLGHVMRKDDWEGLVVTGFVDGKRRNIPHIPQQDDEQVALGLIWMAKIKDVWSKWCTHINQHLRKCYSMMMVMLMISFI